MMKKIYLACPYSHKDKKVRLKRVEQANKKAAELMEEGHLVFSPLSHSHPISEYCNVDPMDHDFWLRQDLWILRGVCDELHVLCLEGWSDSKGVQAEVKVAEDFGMNIYFHQS